MKPYRGEFYENLVLFQDVPYHSVQVILEKCLIRTLDPDEMLLELGEENRYFFQVISGMLSVHLRGTDSPAIGWCVHLT